MNVLKFNHQLPRVCYLPVNDPVVRTGALNTIGETIPPTHKVLRRKRMIFADNAYSYEKQNTLRVSYAYSTSYIQRQSTGKNLYR